MEVTQNSVGQSVAVIVVALVEVFFHGIVTEVVFMLLTIQQVVAVMITGLI